MVWVGNTIPVMPRFSLPFLWFFSRFEQRPHLFDMTQPHRGKGKLSIGQARARKGEGDGESLLNMLR